jgi:twitching motility protein PilT
LKGVISQALLKRKGGGRVAAHEILIGVPAISNLIREGKTFQIPSIMQTSRKHGMIMMNDSLVDLVKRDVITSEEAYAKALDKAGLLVLFKNANIDAPDLATIKA